MGSLKIIKNYLTKNRCYQQNKKRVPIGIQIHTIGCAQGTAQSVADYWNQSGVSACVTYICDCDIPGKVLKLLDEDVYTWADAGFGNRNLITIEICESDFMRYISGTSYEITDRAKFEADVLRGYDTAVALCVDICTRYGWDPLTMLSNGLPLISSHDEGRIAGLSSAHIDPSHLWPKLGLSMDSFRHAVATGIKCGGVVPSDEDPASYYRVRKKWTDVSSQLGAYISLENAKAACPYLYSVFDDKGTAVYQNKTKPKAGTQASEFANLSETASAAKILELVYNTDRSGILPSVTAAQMILESGYGKTTLAKAANNFFGMKATLSGNTWESPWNGKDVVNAPTWEVLNGETVHVNANFRKYPDAETSIKDHSAYLLGAKDGDNLRYAGLLKAMTAEQAINIIKNGGYATDPNYVSKILSLIQRYGLDKYDPAIEVVVPVEKKKGYRVQLGSYKLKANAKKRATQVANRTGFKTYIGETDDGKFVAFCGKIFEQEANAVKRANRLKKLNIDAFVKTVEVES